MDELEEQPKEEISVKIAHMDELNRNEAALKFMEQRKDGTSLPQLQTPTYSIKNTNFTERVIQWNSHARLALRNHLSEERIFEILCDEIPRPRQQHNFVQMTSLSRVQGDREILEERELITHQHRTRGIYLTKMQPALRSV
ncbi:hypothetical protein HNY73_016665 [Argiope bruennichi]|uniref:Uncharacterized protein n=1 Tax=Argiope bruennichi TaxID=94029 RepID=A0A8T0EKN1_ARGBR|nr:hypothetical protein HNY73_016665 [Argiope bruennichi]